MSRRLPIATVKYATDSFNWLRRLNDRVKIAKVNRDGGKFSSKAYSMGLHRDWEPFCDIAPTEVNRKCYPPILALRRIKVWIFKINAQVYYGLKCRKCVIDNVIPISSYF